MDVDDLEIRFGHLERMHEGLAGSSMGARVVATEESERCNKALSSIESFHQVPALISRA